MFPMSADGVDFFGVKATEGDATVIPGDWVSGSPSYARSYDLSPSGLYFASLSGFYAFAFFVLSALRLALIGLLLGAGLFLAAVGPVVRDV